MTKYTSLKLVIILECLYLHIFFLIGRYLIIIDVVFTYTARDRFREEQKRVTALGLIQERGHHSARFRLWFFGCLQTGIFSTERIFRVLSYLVKWNQKIFEKVIKYPLCLTLGRYNGDINFVCYCYLYNKMKGIAVWVYSLLTHITSYL